MLDADILANGKSWSVSSFAQGNPCCGSLPICTFVSLQRSIKLHPLVFRKQEAAQHRHSMAVRGSS